MVLDWIQKKIYPGIYYLTDDCQRCIVLLIMLTGDLERAVLEALTYSDVFDYPLRLDELHYYLPICADREKIESTLRSMRGLIDQHDGYYYLAGRDDIVEGRKDREAHSNKIFPMAMRYGKILGTLPFVRMVALTGSLAVMNVSMNADFDFMLVAKRGRVWTARVFALLLNRIANVFGYTLCPNLIVSDTSLEWSQHDLYSARELHQMIPITGIDVYQRLMEVNSWTNAFLPNAFLSLRGATNASDEAISGSVMKRLFEFLLCGKLGDKFEKWEMTRKIKRFSKQVGFGEETIFTAEVCQGNFHHHRKWTKEMFEEKLSTLEKEVAVIFKVTVTITHQ